MWYLYLDESGDLGFDFVNKRPSKYFTITIVVVKSISNNRKIKSAVKKTIRNKLNPKGKRKRIVEELKGNSTTFDVKNYLFDKLESIDFKIYSITINKLNVFDELRKNKSKVYNFIARKVIDNIDFSGNDKTPISLIVDKCKNKPEIVDFNNYIQSQLEGKLHPKTPLFIEHEDSKKFPGIQLADIFSYGIFKKYEKKHTKWYDVFSKKIEIDELYFK